MQLSVKLSITRIMNKKYLYVAALSLLSLYSCSLDLQPLTNPSSTSYPANIEEAGFGLNAVYASLTAYSASTTTWWKVTDNITDIGATRVNTAMYTELITSGASAENAVTNKLYNCVYKTVARINQLLDALENLRGKASDADIEALRSELLCVRAFCYDQACQHYGDLPYVEHTESVENNQTPRTSREQIIETLLSDLSDECLACLPLRHKAENYGTARLGRVAAYALRARIALNWGKYELAASSAKQALAEAQNAGYGLQSISTAFCGENHEAGEPTGQTALFGYAGENSDEWLWAVQYDAVIASNKTKEAYYMAPRTLGGCSYFGPTQTFIDMFQCKDGKSIVESDLYNWQNPWQNRDPRLDLFCLRPGSRILDIQFETSTTGKKIHDYNTGKDITNQESQGTKGVYGANGTKGPAGYLWRKYLDVAELERAAISNHESTDLNCGLMRLAEVYLIEAEANIEMSNGDLNLARKDINLIRARVGMPDVEAATQAELRKALRYERTVELCNEGFRWFDLRRWDIASKVMTGKIYAPNQKGAMSNAKPIFDENWHPTYSEASSWDGKALNLRVYNTMKFTINKDELWPLPQSEIDTNSAITENNPGY